jgi:hypothetical protein
MLAKYYSLDECFEQDTIYDKLDELSAASKIDYEIVEDDVIRFKDLSLTLKEKKELVKLFEENDVIEYNEWEEEEEDDEEDFDDEDEYEDEDDDF